MTASSVSQNPRPQPGPIPSAAKATPGRKVQVTGTSQLLHILIAQVERREVPGLAPLGPDKSTTILPALKIPLALYRPVVLARGLVKRHANPAADARNLGYEANIGYRASARVRLGKEAYTAGECQTCQECQSDFVEAASQYSEHD